MRRILNSDTAVLVWATLFFILFMTPVSASIYFPLMAFKGFWLTVAILVGVFGVWGTVFYLILLRVDAFDRIKDFLNQMSGKKEPGLPARVQMAIIDLFSHLYKKGGNGKELVSKMEGKMDDARAGIAISWQWIILVFIILSPLFAVPLVRLSFPKEKWLLGVAWVWIGAVVEVATWFLPYYGGIFSIAKAIISSFGGG